MQAYVLVETTTGKAAHVAEAARKIPGVQRADVVMGPHDVIILLEGDDRTLGSVLIEKIRGLEGVEHTLTYMVVE